MKYNKYVIGFNGPPGSGKDTAGQMVKEYVDTLGFEGVLMKYAEPLKIAVNTFLEVPFPEAPHEELKSQITPLGPDVTYRDAYISFSEDFAKKLWGIDVFGKIMARDIMGWEPDEGKSVVFIITDCGFLPEQLPVIEAVGSTNYALIQMVREGHTFTGDSRSYISPEQGYKGRIFNKALGELRLDLMSMISAFIKHGGWK